MPPPSSAVTRAEFIQVSPQRRGDAEISLVKEKIPAPLRFAVRLGKGYLAVATAGVARLSAPVRAASHAIR
jgi:hypothetical protein